MIDFKSAYGEKNNPGSDYAGKTLNHVFGDRPDIYDGVDIEYAFDRFGYRYDGKSDQKNADIMCLGCSFTFGLCVPYEKAWPSVLSQLTGMSSVNFGVCSGSLETTYRVLKHWIGDVSPEHVCLYLPPLSRREVLMSNGQWQNITGTIPEYVTESFLSEYDQEISIKRTLDAIRWVCYIGGATLHVVNSENQDHGGSRDTIHPGVEQHEKIAKVFLNAMERL